MTASALTNADLCNATALRKATRRVSRLYDIIIAPCGLRSTQLSVLYHIHGAGEPAMGELASALVLDRSALAHNLKPLERDGLIELVRSARDGRSRLVRLTTAGRAKVVESRDHWRRAQRSFETAFGAEHAAALRAVLGEIASENFAKRFNQARTRRGVPRSMNKAAAHNS